MRRPVMRGIEKTFDVGFGSTGDDNFEPRSNSGRFGQSLQDDWSTLIVSTLVKSVDDKNESMVWVARKCVNEVKEERVLHCL